MNIWRSSQGWYQALMAVAVLLVGLLGCSPAGTSVTFQRGEAIPLGDYTITVSYTKVSVAGTSKLIEIFIEWKDLPADPDLGIIQRYAKRLSVRDERGKKFYGIEIVPVELWNMAKREGVSQVGIPPEYRYHGRHTQWVYPVRVPLESSSFTLAIKNPDRRPGQPSLALVPL